MEAELEFVFAPDPGGVVVEYGIELLGGVGVLGLPFQVVADIGETGLVNAGPAAHAERVGKAQFGVVIGAQIAGADEKGSPRTADYDLIEERRREDMNVGKRE